MRLIARDGKFTIGGTPWLAEGEFKTVGFNALTGKCLCENHNSALHPLDDAALAFFRFLRAAYESDTDPQRSVVSGHDVERWLLKTLKAMATSGNLGKGREKLTGQFAKGIDVVGLLENPKTWERGTGLYCVMAPGDTMVNHNRFQLAPLTDGAEALLGLWANIMGLSFILLLKPLDLRHYGVTHPAYRPEGINIAFPKNQNTILFSWDDGERHKGALGLNFQKKVF